MSTFVYRRVRTDVINTAARYRHYTHRLQQHQQQQQQQQYNCHYNHRLHPFSFLHHEVADDQVKHPHHHCPLQSPHAHGQTQLKPPLPRVHHKHRQRGHRRVIRNTSRRRQWAHTSVISRPSSTLPRHSYFSTSTDNSNGPNDDDHKNDPISNHKYNHKQESEGIKADTQGRTEPASGAQKVPPTLKQADAAYTPTKPKVPRTPDYMQTQHTWPYTLPPSMFSETLTMTEIKDRFNYTLTHYPTPSFTFYLALKLSFFGGFYALLHGIGFNDPTLVLAVGASQAVKRFRLPLDVLVTSLVAKVCPILTQINVMALVAPPPPAEDGASSSDSFRSSGVLQALLPPDQRDAALFDNTRFHALGDKEKDVIDIRKAKLNLSHTQMSSSASSSSASSPKAEVGSMDKVMNLIHGPINKYGAALLTTRCGTGLCTAFAFYGAVSMMPDMHTLTSSLADVDTSTLANAVEGSTHTAPTHPHAITSSIADTGPPGPGAHDAFAFDQNEHAQSNGVLIDGSAGGKPDASASVDDGIMMTSDLRASTSTSSPLSASSATAAAATGDAVGLDAGADSESGLVSALKWLGVSPETSEKATRTASVLSGAAVLNSLSFPIATYALLYVPLLSTRLSERLLEASGDRIQSERRQSEKEKQQEDRKKRRNGDAQG